jgi:hypothetical protein
MDIPFRKPIPKSRPQIVERHFTAMVVTAEKETSNK